MSQQRYEIFNQIIANEQGLSVEGREIKVISAYLMVNLINRLQIKNKERLYALNLSIRNFELICWNVALNLTRHPSDDAIDNIFKQYYNAFETENFSTTTSPNGVEEPLSLNLPLDFLMRLKKSGESLREKNGVSYPIPKINHEEKYSILNHPKKTFDETKKEVSVECEGFTIGSSESFSIIIVAEKLSLSSRDKFLALPVDTMLLISLLMIFETLNRNRCTVILADSVLSMCVWRQFKISWGNEL